MEYYYEEDYPDCFGESQNYLQQPACLTCVWKTSCKEQIQTEDNMDIWEREYECQYSF